MRVRERGRRGLHGPIILSSFAPCPEGGGCKGVLFGCVCFFFFFFFFGRAVWLACRVVIAVVGGKRYIFFSEDAKFIIRNEGFLE